MARAARGSSSQRFQAKLEPVEGRWQVPTLILIPFVAFAACVLGQFYFMWQVRRALASRHPDVWRDLSVRSFFINNAVFSFVWNKRDQELNDPDLESITHRMRMLQIIAIAIWLICVVMMFTGLGVHNG